MLNLTVMQDCRHWRRPLLLLLLLLRLGVCNWWWRGGNGRFQAGKGSAGPGINAHVSSSASNCSFRYRIGTSVASRHCVQRAVPGATTWGNYTELILGATAGRRHARRSPNDVSLLACYQIQIVLLTRGSSERHFVRRAGTAGRTDECRRVLRDGMAGAARLVWTDSGERRPVVGEDGEDWNKCRATLLLLSSIARWLMSIKLMKLIPWAATLA